MRERWGLGAAKTSRGRQIEIGEPARLTALAPTGAPRNSLPIQLTSFVGRERELAEIGRLLGTTRLLTLTGTGGCGKTRLALRVAADLLSEYPDGAWLAELAPLTDPSLVAPTVAFAVGAQEEPGLPVIAALVSYLRSRHLLLLLDNCEHLVEASASLAEALLTACPRLRIIATSRQTLGVEGEVVWRVPSLTLPDEEAQSSAEQIADSESVRLFVERARLVEPGFALTNQNAPTVAQICRRLDGIPLAIELAAARARVLSPEQIARRLEDSFSLLVGGSRSALPRQQTLKATIDWSYDLLTDSERALLRRLSAFAGGFTLEAAEDICSDSIIAQAVILDLLTQLVDKSLVQVEAGAGLARYRLLETVRQYASDRLAEAGEMEAIQRRHAGWCLKLVERAEPELYGPETGMWLDRLDAETDDLRATLRWCHQHDSVEGLRLAVGLSRWWELRGFFAEGRLSIEGLLATTPDDVEETRAWALLRAGALANYQWDHGAARPLLQSSLALFRELGNRRGIGWALLNLGWSHRGDPSGRGEALYEESLETLTDADDRRGACRVLQDMAMIARARGDSARAVRLLGEALEQARLAGDDAGAAWVLNGLGTLAHANRDLGLARSLLEESLSTARRCGNRPIEGGTLGDLGNLAMSSGEYGEARALLEESLASSRQAEWRLDVFWRLLFLGHLARLEGRLAEARATLEESLAAARRRLAAATESRRHVGLSLGSLGQLARAEGDIDRATVLLRDSLTVLRSADARIYVGHFLWILGAMEVVHGAHARGIALMSAARAGGAPEASLSYPPDHADWDAALASSRATLGEDGFARAWAEGAPGDEPGAGRPARAGSRIVERWSLDAVGLD